MSEITFKASTDVRSLTKRICRKNTKDRLAYELSKIWHTVQNSNDSKLKSEMQKHLENVLW